MTRLKLSMLLSFFGLMILLADFNLGFSMFTLGFGFLIVMLKYFEGRLHTQTNSKSAISLARLWQTLAMICALAASLSYFFLTLFAAFIIFQGANALSNFTFLLACFGMTSMSIWLGLYDRPRSSSAHNKSNLP
ncbi:hypothetical protein [Undibacterium sp. Ren11W]|uniref:hypothetical protein n=1 Tax=Undibacterium sp. Ren11W TaxID=3413045 RepID=UPI003BF292BC